jgi:hypothetical protein
VKGIIGAISFALVIIGLAVADEVPPPSVPVNRERPRLVHNKWAIKGKLYAPSEMVDAAFADMMIFSARTIGIQPIDVIPSLKNKTVAYSPAMSYIRYLTLYNYPPGMRDDVYASVSFLLNSLSRSSEIVRPALGGPDNTIIRVNLFDYGIDPKVWDSFATNEPYFHVGIDEWEIVTTLVWDTYVATDGKTYYKTSLDQYGRNQYTTKNVQEKKLRSVRAPTAWGPPTAMEGLVYLCQSKAPIIRADWFIVNASRPPAYYDLLGLKTLKDFDDLVAFDKRAERKEVRATVVESGSDGLCPKVAENNRILARRPTFQGYRWETYDYLTSIGKNNVINNFLNRKRDAGEFIGSLPNGLQVYFLTNGNDERVDEADIKVARDSMSADARVITGRSCMWCHASGINAFRSNFQLQVGQDPAQADLGIYDKNKEKALELSLYIRKTFGSPDFRAIIEGDQRTYAVAVIAANNRMPETNASLFKQLWDGYDVERLDMPRIIYEVGLSEADIRMLLPLRVDGRNNGVLNQQLLVPPVAIRRDHWEEAFPELMKLTLLRRAGK